MSGWNRRQLTKTAEFGRCRRSGTHFADVYPPRNSAGTQGHPHLMSTIDQSRLLSVRATILSQNGALQRAAGHIADAKADTGVDPLGAGPSFGKTMVDALSAVNAQQGKANDLSAAYERGDTHDIVQVMVERQKAAIGFEASLQVRNKLLSAYRDIMNMPV
jgi:flagellar hook-basal body complex protein FliE